MATNPFSREENIAVKERPTLRTILFWAIAGLLILAVVLTVAVILPRSAPAAESAAPASVSAPAEAEATAEPESPSAPPEASRVPADTSVEAVRRNVVRRDGFPLLSWDVSAFSLNAQGRMTYSGGVKTLTGIDVSEHQGEINWKKVAADGVDFAMIRVGYRGSTAGGLYLDEYYEQNITGALKAGIPVGLYFFSQAVTPQEAAEEARFVLEQIGDRKITYPVVFDWEIVGGTSARTYSVTRQTLCECTRTFCDAVSAAGYDPMIYFTQYLGYRKYILRNLTDYGFWYAEYEEQPRFAFDFDMWQYSETGQVDGIDGGVDLNIYFPRS